MSTRIFLLTLTLANLLAGTLRANNIQISNTTVTGNTGSAVQVQFDLSWENSWRGGGVTNWDAAWVFIKYRASATGPWAHVNINNTGNVAPAGSQIDLGLQSPGQSYHASNNPALGVFIYRNAAGTGPLTLSAIQLKWDYSYLAIGFNNIYQIEVFAMEMVYVPPGEFAAGSGGTEPSAFTLTTINTTFAGTAPSGTGSLGGQAGGYPTGQIAPTAFNWPNGVAAYYSMKYELSQQQYVDFLNTLTYTQQVTRTATAPNSAAGTGTLSSTNFNRNGIDIQTPGVASSTPAIYACNLNGNAQYGEVTDGTDIACNFLSWGDLTAYLDWSGLRPMTELEFEKACRGPVLPVANEYPWGTTDLAASPYGLANVGAPNEGISTNYSTT
ncbi:MAG: SUMF1/EgtB/PvdO family nonheme iron enzyme, partial [Bacteroidota bacterium]|nr:SUMF1/EgtB/PvdO family nonheme iron enzyme [Bacteroidota bacterium]